MKICVFTSEHHNGLQLQVGVCMHGVYVHVTRYLVSVLIIE